MLEWLLSFLRKMTDAQKRELARAFLAPSPTLYELLEEDNFTVRAVDEIIADLEKKKKAEEPVVMTVEQMRRANQAMESIGCPPAIPWVDKIEGQNRSSADEG